MNWIRKKFTEEEWNLMENIYSSKDTEKRQKLLAKKDKLMVSFICRMVLLGILAIFVIVALFNSFYVVKDTEAAVITTFGRAETVTEKGIHLKIPFVQQVAKVDTTVRGFTIGYNESTNEDVDSESVMITSDYNFIDIDYYISYQIVDPYKYLYATDNPETVLKNMAIASIRSVMSAYPVDAALTTAKAEIQSNVRQMIIQKLEDEDIGIILIEASIQDVEPPTEEVRYAFTNVETARQNMNTSINNANTYRNEQLPAAQATADQIIQEATADRDARINEANGLVAKFNTEYEEYQNFPLITRQRMFYETMSEVLPHLRVIITNGEDVQTIYPIDSLIEGGGSN